MKIPDFQKKICFVSLGAYPILSGKNLKTILGPDVHQILLAKELVKLKFNVTIIAIEPEGTKVEYFEGIKVIKIRNKWNRYGRIGILFKIFEIWVAMSRENSDIYYQGGSILGIIIPFCKIFRKKGIYRVASDALIDQNVISRKIPEFTKSKYSLIFITNLIEIKLADRIVVQNEFQTDTIKKKFSRNSVKIIGPFKKANPRLESRINKEHIILWVGSLTPVKQPELFLELAKSIPHAKFILIGGCLTQNEYNNRIKEESEHIPNLELMGVIPFNKIDEYYRNANILVNTSLFEGFPNSFFQAWLNKVPVVSLNCDPDNMIKKYNIGFHSQTFKKMISDIITLLENDEVNLKMKNNLENFIDSELNNETVMVKFIELLHDL